MNLSRKRKKELRRLQDDAGKLWQTQQSVANEALGIAREAGRQLGNFNREVVTPQVRHAYETQVVPAVDRGVRFTRHVVDDRVIPAVGGVVGSALSVWDAANARRSKLLGSHGGAPIIVQPEKKRMGTGGVIAIILGAAAAIGVLYAAWQTLRNDDELWVAEDPVAESES